jgi:hypothetical protein
VLYDSNQNKFEAIPNKESFIKNEKLIISPLKSNAKGQTITYVFKNSLFFDENSNKTIEQLTADFETGQTYHIIQNSELTTYEIAISYNTSGVKALHFTAIFDDGSTLTTSAAINISITPIPQDLDTIVANIPFQGYDESQPILGQLEYRTFFHQYGSNLQKPIIFIDGFDPEDKRKILRSEMPNPSDLSKKSIKELIAYNLQPNSGEQIPFIQDFQNAGYDVIIVNHPTYQRNIGGVTKTIDGGADYIERNAMAHIALYQELNNKLAQNGSTEELVIMGPSMGGQISKYALAYMENEYELETDPVEKEKWNHNTRLWVSLDSPHQGTNIPMGSQANIFFLGYTHGDQEAKDKYDKKVNSVAGKQQLKFQFSNTFPDTYSWNGRVFPTGNNSTPPPFHTQYYNNVANNGLSGSNGYPQNLRRVSMINGSLAGVKNGEKGKKIFDIQATVGSTLVFHNKVHFVNDSNQSNQIFYGKGMDASWWPPQIEWYSWQVDFTNNLTFGSLDAIPGSTFNTQQVIRDEVVDALEILEEDDDIDEFDEITLFSNHTFMPTHSTLDTNGFSNWYQSIGHNIKCSNQTPFHNYYGEPVNTGHVTFTLAAKEWLFEELANNNPSPPVYTQILGDNTICYNETKTYQLEEDASCIGDATWSTSSTLTINPSNTNAHEVEVTLTNSNTSLAWIKAYFDDNGASVKRYIVGKPYCELYIVEPYSGEIETEILVKNKLPILSGTQDITDYVWEQTGGDGLLDYIDGYPDAVAIQDVIGNVKVYNSCGYTQLNFNVGESSNYNCENPYYYIESLGQNKYKLVDYCNPENSLYVDSSELYDKFGVKVQDLIPEQDEVNIDNTSNSGTIRIILFIKDGQVITKKIISD